MTDKNLAEFVTSVLSRTWRSLWNTKTENGCTFPNLLCSIIPAFLGWSPNIGMNIAVTPLSAVSWTEPIPPWVTNRERLGWAKLSYCSKKWRFSIPSRSAWGIHLVNSRFSDFDAWFLVKSSSNSYFQMNVTSGRLSPSENESFSEMYDRQVRNKKKPSFFLSHTHTWPVEWRVCRVAKWWELRTLEIK